MNEEAGSLSGASPRRDERPGEIVLERGPGVHVIADAHPARAGRALAAALGADLADTAAAADLAISERLDNPTGASAPADVIDLREDTRGAGGLTGASDAGNNQLLAERLAAYDAAAPTRTLVLANAARLRLLAAAVERAERVRALTEEAARSRLRESSRSAPSRAAGDDLSTAPPHADVPEAAPLAEPAQPGTTLQQVRPATPAGPIAQRDIGSPDSALIAGGVLLLSVALAGAILLTALPPILAIAPILLGLFVAALIRRTTPVPRDRFSTSAGTDTLTSTRGSGVSIDAPTAGEAQRARGSQEPDRDVEPSGTALGEQHDPIEEAARKDESDDALVDPAPQTASVRAADRLLGTARQAWETAWAELGEQPPAVATPGPEIDAALMRLQQRIGGDDDARDAGDRPNVEDVSDSESHPATRRRLNELLGSRNLQAVVAAEAGPLVFARSPLVLVEPFAGLDPDRRATMQRRLDVLAAHHEVIVIVSAHTAGELDIDA